MRTRWMRRSVLVKVPSFSAKLAAGQHHVGVVRRLAVEDLLQDHELGLVEGLAHVVEVRVAGHGVLADDVEAAHLARGQRLRASR